MYGTLLRSSIFCRFRIVFKIHEQLPNTHSIIIVEKTRQPRTLDPAESFQAANREKKGSTCFTVFSQFVAKHENKTAKKMDITNDTEQIIMKS